MNDNFFDNKHYRKHKLKQDEINKHKFTDDDKKIKHQQSIEHKKNREEFDEDEWEYWKNYYK